MKKLILFVIILFSIETFAQNKFKNIDVKWGNEVKTKGFFQWKTLDDIVGKNDNGFYVLRNTHQLYYFLVGYVVVQKPYLEFYSKNLNLQSAAPIKPIKLNDGNKCKFADIIQSVDNLYMLSISHDKKRKKSILYSHSVNENTLAISEAPKKLAEVSYKGKNNDWRFNCKLSKDSTVILVSYNMPYNKKDEKEGFGFNVYDQNFDQLWKKEITLPYTDKLFTVNNYKVDNTGKVYVLGTLYKDKVKTKRHGEPNYEYHLLTYTSEGEKANYTISLGDKFITDMDFMIDANNNIIAAGFYSEEGNLSIKGVFQMRIDGNTQEILSKNKSEFDTEFLKNFMSDRKAEKGEELPEYVFKDFVENSDGSVTLVAEQYYVVVRTTTTTDSRGNIRTTTHYYYHYNDILAVNLSEDGKINWASKVPKTQVSRDDGGYYLSYSLIPANGKLYFIFNDFVKRMEDEIKGKKFAIHFTLGPSVIAVAEIDQSGKVTKNILLSNKETDVRIRPKVSENISNNEMLVISQKKKKARLGKLTFHMDKVID